LRCKKCLALLARDCDFEYKNGQLCVTPEIFKSGWEGIVMKGNTVYCQNIHPIGHKRSTTWTDQTIFVPVLTVTKTTFKENFLDNPDFQGSFKKS